MQKKKTKPKFWNIRSSKGSLCNSMQTQKEARAKHWKTANIQTDPWELAIVQTSVSYHTHKNEYDQN